MSQVQLDHRVIKAALESLVLRVLRVIKDRQVLLDQPDHKVIKAHQA